MMVEVVILVDKRYFWPTVVHSLCALLLRTGRYEKDLVRARELHEQLTHKWNSFDSKMTQAKASAEALDLRLESVTASEEQLESEIRDLQIKIREQVSRWRAGDEGNYCNLPLPCFPVTTRLVSYEGQKETCI